MREDGTVIIGTGLDTKSFDNQIADVERKLEEIDAILSDPIDIESDDFVKLNAEAERLNNRLQTLYDQKEKLEKQGMENFISSLQDAGKQTERIIKKIIRWTGYVIGIRSAYQGVRKIMSIVESENENIASQLKTMGAVFSSGIANVFSPMVQKIVDLIAKLMMYVDYIYYKLTSKRLFDFSKTFESANKSSSGIAKNMNKITAGFDEMNVLQDNSSAGAGAIGGGGTYENPFEGWENFKPPKWLDNLVKILDWIKKNWKAVVIGIGAIVGAFLLFKALQFIKGIIDSLKGVKEVGETLKGVSVNFTGFFDGLGKGIEAIAILGGLALVIKEVTNMIKIFSESGLEVSDVLGLMGAVVGTVIALITAMTLATQVLQSPTAMAGLVLLTASISAILIVIKETLPDILDAVGDFIVKVGPTLNQILDTMGKNLALIIYQLGTALPPILDSLGKLFDKIFGGIDKIVNTVGDTIVRIMQTAKDTIVTVLYTILDFINKLGPAVNWLVDNIIWAVTKLINFMISGIEYMINTLVIGAIRGLINKINDVIPGDSFDLNVPGNVSIPRFYPRLARGGIVNNPGAGVMMGSYIAGEKGAEAVLPLTDDTLQRLANMMPITVNLTNTMNGRVISRELKKVQNENSFAYNG